MSSRNQKSQAVLRTLKSLNKKLDDLQKDETPRLFYIFCQIIAKNVEKSLVKIPVFITKIKNFSIVPWRMSPENVL